MTDIPFGSPGLASSATENFEQFDLLLSNTPTFFTDEFEVAASQTLAIYSVVAIDTSNRIIPAVYHASSAHSSFRQAIGITTAAITTAAGETPKIQIALGGHFNGDFLDWPTTFNTDAIKMAAFRGANTPTQIVIGFNKFNRK